MHLVSLVMALEGLLFGIAAAYFWWRAGQVSVAPTWGINEPHDSSMSQAGWIAGLLMASAVSARLNRVAALLTGIAVILTTASSVASFL